MINQHCIFVWCLHFQKHTFFRPTQTHQNLGVYDEKVAEFGSCHRSKKSRNFSRAMHRMIHRKDKTLPVRLSSVDVKVKVPRRRKLLVKPWPVLYMTDWARLCFENSKYNGFFSWVGTPWIPGMMPKLCSELSGVDTKTLILVLCQSIPLKLFRSTSMEMKEGGWAKDLCW